MTANAVSKLLLNPKVNILRVQGVYIHRHPKLHLRKEREVDLPAYVMDVQRRTVGIASTV